MQVKFKPVQRPSEGLYPNQVYMPCYLCKAPFGPLEWAVSLTQTKRANQPDRRMAICRNCAGAIARVNTEILLLT